MYSGVYLHVNHLNKSEFSFMTRAFSVLWLLLTQQLKGKRFLLRRKESRSTPYFVLVHAWGSRHGRTVNCWSVISQGSKVFLISFFSMCHSYLHPFPLSSLLCFLSLSFLLLSLWFPCLFLLLCFYCCTLYLFNLNYSISFSKTSVFCAIMFYSFDQSMVVLH